MVDVIEKLEIIDITKYKKENNIDEKEKLQCIWELDEIHDEVVAVASMFDGQLKLPICNRHLTWHQALLTLNSKGVDLDKLLDMTRDEIMQEMVARGLIPTRQ